MATIDNAPVVKPTKEDVLRTVDELLKSDKSTWEYVTVPTENALGDPHAPLGLNKLSFLPGQTYHLPKQIANFVKERLQVYARASVRVLRPNRDVVAENAVAVGSVQANQIGATPVDPSLFDSQQ